MERGTHFILATNWWAVALRGVCGILFGLGALFWPGIAIAALVFMFGAYALVGGIFTLVAAVRAGARQERWGALMVEGIVGLLAGVWAFTMPAITILALLFLIAGWAIVTGVMDVVAAIRLRRTIRGEWLLGLAGVLSILFGVMLVLSPVAGAVVLAMWVGAYALVTGILQLALSFRLRSWKKRLTTADSDDQRLAA